MNVVSQTQTPTDLFTTTLRPDVPEDSPSRDVDSLLVELHETLQATAELPVNRDANAWLGEAEAVAADAATADLPARAVEKRIDQVQMLLAELDTTGHAEADEHITDARELAAKIDEQLQR